MLTFYHKNTLRKQNQQHGCFGSHVEFKVKLGM